MSLYGGRKLVMLYGPPAVGKLTVGKELAKQLSASLFHNHLTYDLATELLAADSSFETRRRFACQLRLSAMALLLESDHRDVITTFCYSGPEDDWYVDALQALCADHRTTPCFVRLKAPDERLIDRVENADRRAFGKVNSRANLAAILREFAYMAPLRSDNHICIDTSELLPHDAATAIVEWSGGASSNL
ncbi:AAA family ATPase [Xanthomonas hyacinthi]|uniref:AAA family ATPase n=1 Tax=Xanthomonas hyacinthi TaxID=56455 RepID=A0A2S7EWY1_9XANT|nr:AAA family ATPase [Xanthomonas hyacinthi]KLD76115.1 ATPase AAA [Xanthomonas hyacinthi DSM 19077]PPU97668.1 AAA family ATPase [Xanthomonas hyacinthi]QGY77146.1 AAA family ATPase [Xanthomonas hyacinthi]